MKEYKLFVQRIGLVGVTNIFISLSTLILLPILSKNLTIQNLGVWNLFNTYLSFIPLFINLGLPYTMVRYLPVKTEKEDIKEGFYSIMFITLFVGLIALGILLLFSNQIALVLFDGNTSVSILLAIGTVISVMSVSFFTFFRTFQQMKIYSILQLAQTYLGVFMVAFFVYSGYQVNGAVLGYVISQFIVFLIVMAFVIHEIGFKFPKFENLREYISFGLPTVPGNFSSWLVDLSDRTIIGIFLGTAFVGYYSPGYTLGNIIMMFSAPFTLLLPSLLSSYYDNNRIDEVRKHLDYSIKYFLLIAIPAVFGLSILSKPLLNVLTTQAIAQNGYIVTPFVALGALIFGVQGIITQILLLEKKTKVIGSRWIAAGVLNVVLNIILVPFFGIIAAGITTLIAYVFVCLITSFYSLKFIKLNFDFIFILKSISASVLMSFVLLFINPVSFVGIVATVGVCAVVYLLVILLLKGISPDELNFFKKMVKN
ncbi:oligosaccharide flippase family protein [Methanobacterium sp.]|uniref:oligosaccharide flippase family protein n=1 Tax=Methanobacterium sp. TaxID=2164 RepID=UPI003158962A